MKKIHLMKHALAVGIIGTMAFGDAVPAFAAPVMTNTAVVKTTAPDLLDQVRVRRRSRGIGAGVALGVVGALVGAAAVQNRYYYGPGYYGPGYGYYGGPGYYSPGYYGPGYYGQSYYGPGYYGPAYDPGAAIALGVIGAAAGAIAAAPYRTRAVRGGRCWVTTDADRNYGYWGSCYR